MLDLFFYFLFVALFGAEDSLLILMRKLDSLLFDAWEDELPDEEEEPDDALLEDF